MIEITKRTISKIVGGKEIVETAQMIGSMAAQLDQRNIQPGRIETYNEARTRLRVNNDELETMRLNHARIFWIAVVFLFIAWAVRFYVGFSIQDMLLTITYSFICFALMFRHSFRASQLKERKLHSVQEWAGNKALWIPKI